MKLPGDCRHDLGRWLKALAVKKLDESRRCKDRFHRRLRRFDEPVAVDKQHAAGRKGYGAVLVCRIRHNIERKAAAVYGEAAAAVGNQVCRRAGCSIGQFALSKVDDRAESGGKFSGIKNPPQELMGVFEQQSRSVRSQGVVFKGIVKTKGVKGCVFAMARQIGLEYLEPGAIESLEAP